MASMQCRLRCPRQKGRFCKVHECWCVEGRKGEAGGGGADGVWHAPYTYLESSEIYYIQRDDLMKLIKKTPSIAFMLIRALIRKIRLLAFQLEDLSFLDAQKRVAHILLTLGHELGVRKEDGLHIQKGITHNDLAQLTGLSRVTVTNVLNYLERLHIIRKRRCMLTIIDQERLANLLGTSSIETTGH